MIDGPNLKSFFLSWEGFWTAVSGAVLATITFIKLVPEVLRLLITFRDGALYTLAIKETFGAMKSEILERLGKLDDGQINQIEWRRHTLDADGLAVYFQADAQGHTEWVTKTWTKWTGLDTDEAIGNGWENGIAPEDLPRVMQNWQLAIQGRRDYQDSFSYVDRQGVRTPVEVKATAIRRADGTILNYCGNARKTGSATTLGAHFLPGDHK